MYGYDTPISTATSTPATIACQVMSPRRVTGPVGGPPPIADSSRPSLRPPGSPPYGSWLPTAPG